jgi:Sporulation and spore germination
MARSMKFPRPVLVGCAALLIGASAACGATTQDDAERVPPGDVPFRLLAPGSPPSTSPSPSSTPGTFLYFLAGDVLVPVERDRSGLTPLEVLVLLVRGPTADDDSELRTAIPPGAVIHDAHIDAGTLIVDLGESFLDAGGGDQHAAIAQIVFTATARRGLDQVRFTVNGEPVAVPLPDGTLSDAPLRRADVTRVPQA